MSTTAPDTLVPELSEYLHQIDAIRADAERLVAGLGDDAFNRHPGAGRWSVGDCIVHLNITAEHYLPPIAQAIEEARASGLLSDGPYRHDLLGRLFARTLEPPYRMRVRASKPFVPAGTHDRQAVVGRFMELQNRLGDTIRAANGVDLGTVRVQSLFVSWARYSLGTTLRIILAHERRHLWQAWRAREAVGA